MSGVLIRQGIGLNADVGRAEEEIVARPFVCFGISAVVLRDWIDRRVGLDKAGHEIGRFKICSPNIDGKKQVIQIGLIQSGPVGRIQTVFKGAYSLTCRCKRGGVIAGMHEIPGFQRIRYLLPGRWISIEINLRASSGPAGSAFQVDDSLIQQVLELPVDGDLILKYRMFDLDLCRFFKRDVPV